MTAPVSADTDQFDTDSPDTDSPDVDHSDSDRSEPTGRDPNGTSPAAAGAAMAANPDRAGGVGTATDRRQAEAASGARKLAAPGALERLADLLDRLLVLDVFLVIGAALWFGGAVLLQARGVEAPLRLFQQLWQPLFTPAIGLLMAAALFSGARSWWRRRGQR